MISRAMARRPLGWVLRRRPCWGRVPAGGWRRRPWCRSSPRTRPPLQPLLRLLWHHIEWKKRVRARQPNHICSAISIDLSWSSPIKAKKRNQEIKRERCEDKRPKLSESEHNRDRAARRQVKHFWRRCGARQH